MNFEFVCPWVFRNAWLFCGSFGFRFYLVYVYHHFFLGLFTASLNEVPTHERKRSMSMSDVSDEALAGRPKRRLSFSENAVWNTTDHNYVKTQITTPCMFIPDETSVKADDEKMKSKFLRQY